MPLFAYSVAIATLMLSFASVPARADSLSGAWSGNGSVHYSRSRERARCNDTRGGPIALLDRCYGVCDRLSDARRDLVERLAKAWQLVNQSAYDAWPALHVGKEIINGQGGCNNGRSQGEEYCEQKRASGGKERTSCGYKVGHLGFLWRHRLARGRKRGVAQAGSRLNLKNSAVSNDPKPGQARMR